MEDGFTVDVTDGRFVDSHPVFTLDGLYLAFLSRRTFDPVYDMHSFDLSFPFGARPYLVPLAAHTLSPFGPLPGGRPVGAGDNAKDAPERVRLTVDTDGISSRVVAVPVDESRYFGLAAAKGGLLWLRSPLSGVLGEGTADPDDAHPRPALERFDLRKRESSVLASEVSWFTVSGDGARIVIGDRGDVRVVPSDRKVDNGSSDEVVIVVLTRARFLEDPAALWRHAYAEFSRSVLRRDFWTPDMSGVDWDGTLDRSTGSCSTGSGPRPAEFGDPCSGRWPANSARRLRLRHAVGHLLQPLGAAQPSPPRCSARTWSATPDGRWIVERVLPGESSDPHARSPFTAPGVAVPRGRRDPSRWTASPLDSVYGPWAHCGPGGATHGKPVEALTVKPADPLPGAPPQAAAPAEDTDDDRPLRTRPTTRASTLARSRRRAPRTTGRTAASAQAAPGVTPASACAASGTASAGVHAAAPASGARFRRPRSAAPDAIPGAAIPDAAAPRPPMAEDASTGRRRPPLEFPGRPAGW